MPQQEEMGSPAELSPFGLKMSYWYITHKFQLRRIATGVLIALCVCLFAVSGYRAYVLFFVEQRGYGQMLQAQPLDLVNYEAFRKSNAAKPLELATVSVLGGRDGRYDVLVGLRNENTQFMAKRVVVRFLSGAKVITEKTTFVYPGEQKYVGAFGIALGGAAQPEVQLVSTEWQRVRGFDDFLKNHLVFTIANAKFMPSDELPGLSGKLPVSGAHFDVSNDSAYAYRQVGFYVLLMNGDQIAGANYIALDAVKSGEKRSVDVRWYEVLPPVSSVVVIPDVDITDTESYLPVGR